MLYKSLETARRKFKRFDAEMRTIKEVYDNTNAVNEKIIKLFKAITFNLVSERKILPLKFQDSYFVLSRYGIGKINISKLEYTKKYNSLAYTSQLNFSNELYEVKKNLNEIIKYIPIKQKARRLKLFFKQFKKFELKLEFKKDVDKKVCIVKATEDIGIKINIKNLSLTCGGMFIFNFFEDNNPAFNIYSFEDFGWTDRLIIEQVQRDATSFVIDVRKKMQMQLKKIEKIHARLNDKFKPFLMVEELKK